MTQVMLCKLSQDILRLRTWQCDDLSDVGWCYHAAVCRPAARRPQVRCPPPSLRSWGSPGLRFCRTIDDHNLLDGTVRRPPYLPLLESIRSFSTSSAMRLSAVFKACCNLKHCSPKALQLQTLQALAWRSTSAAPVLQWAPPPPRCSTSTNEDSRPMALYS